MWITVIITIIGVLLVLFILNKINNRWIKPFMIKHRTLWRFLKEFKSFNKSFWKYLMLITNPNIETILLKLSNNIVYGGFIIEHKKRNTYVRNLAFVPLDGDLNKFKQIIGRIESQIFMRNSQTVIHYSLHAKTNEEVIDALKSLGYKHLRTNYSTFKIELVKSKIMN